MVKTGKGLAGKARLGPYSRVVTELMEKDGLQVTTLNRESRQQLDGFSPL